MIGSKILVADDDPAIIYGLELRLRTAGFEPVCVCNGLEAIDAARWHRPAAIILDINMPDLDGLSVMKQLQGDPATSHIPVIVFTGSDQERYTALRAGAFGFLHKPYSSASLLAAVSAALVLRPEPVCV